jgi:hypothetical protein
MNKINEEKRYCSECGSKMIVEDVPAETEEVHCYYGDCIKMRIGSPYNSKNGKRQYVKHYYCPNFKKHWLRSCRHDNFYDDQIFVKN